MKVSFHKRRVHDSLPPQPSRRRPTLLAVAVALTTGTMAFAAANIGDDEPAVVETFDPAVAAAESSTRDVVDERVRAHLRNLR